MKKEEYERIIEYAKDPYQGFLAKEEQSDSDLADMAQVALREIEEEYVILKDREVLMDEKAPIWIIEAIRQSHAVFLYGDEDEIIEPPHVKIGNPFFRPDFSPDMLEGSFYPGGLIVVKKSAFATYLQSVDPKDYTGVSGDFFVCEDADDLKQYALKQALAKGMLRCLQTEGRGAICHIPKMLSHRSAEDPGVNHWESPFEDCVKREGTDDIGVVILSKDNPGMLLSCIDSLLSYGGLPVKIVVVDNGSSEENRLLIEKELKIRGCSYIYTPQPFQYSTLCNIGAEACDTQYLLFFNDDVVVPESAHGFLESMKMRAARPHAGAVGIRLRYPDDTIQHVGIVQLLSGPSHVFATCRDDKMLGYGQNRITYNPLAVTGACLMVEKHKFDQVGGFDEILHIAYTDVDLCVDLYEAGYYSIMVNEQFLYHHESVSRGRESLDEKKAERLLQERRIFYEKHPWVQDGDPFYNPNLTKTRNDATADYDSPWENTEMPSEAQDMVCDYDIVAECSGEKRIPMSIDRISHIASSFESEENYREIEGWVFAHGKNNIKYDPVLVLADEKGTQTFVRVRRKLRSDLSQVFPKEKNVALSGFVIRIPDSVWDRIAPAKVGAGVLYTAFFGARKIEFRMSDAVESFPHD